MASSTSIIRKKPPVPDTSSPQRQDESWAGGHMPDGGADDSVDSLVKEMELYQDTEDGVAELDIAGQINQAERNRHFDAE